MYHEMRGRIVDLPVEGFHLAPTDRFPTVVAALMEISWTENLISSVVAVADGSCSIYLSSGGGFIGGGGQAPIAEAGERFLETVEQHRDLLRPIDPLPLPAVGEVRFNVRTYDGAKTALGREIDITAGDRSHPLLPLYAAGQEIITQFRLFDERQPGKR